MSLLETYHPLPLTIAVLLFVISVSTLGITSHTIWLLAQYFPAGAWYIWREQSDVYEEQQTRQQWIAVDYNDTTDRLALVRAVLGAAAGLLGICVSRVRRRSVVEDEIKVLFFSCSVSCLLLTIRSDISLLLPEYSSVYCRSGLCNRILHQHTDVRHMVYDSSSPIVRALPRTNIPERVQQ